MTQQRSPNLQKPTRAGCSRWLSCRTTGNSQFPSQTISWVEMGKTHTHTHNKKQPCQSLWGFRNKQGKFLKKWIQMYPQNIPDLFAHLYIKRKLFCLVFVICSIILFWNICLKNFYISWNDDYNKFSEHLSSHTDRKLRKWKKNFFLVMKTLRIYSLNNFQKVQTSSYKINKY